MKGKQHSREALGINCLVWSRTLTDRFLRALLVSLTVLLSSTVVAAPDDTQALNLSPITFSDGSSRDLTDVIGKKPVYLKFWASWCKPCMQQMPHLQHTYETYADNVEIISVNIFINESQAEIDNVVAKFGLTVPIALDKDGSLAQTFKFIGTPYHILLDKNGNAVHKGHDASPELDRKIALLAGQNGGDMPAIALTDNTGKQTSLTDLQTTDGIVMFTATWCDWYLADTRPIMAKACADGQTTINQLQQSFPELHWFGVVSHLWTGEDELQEYINKFNVPYPVAIDSMGDVFFTHGVKRYPTVILFKDGKARFRSADLTDIQPLKEAIDTWLR